MSQEKRTLPRFHITPCQFHEGKSGKNFSIQDISLGGLALRLVERTDLPDFAVGSVHEGVIKVEGKKIQGKFQVKFIRGTLIGAEWEQPAKELLTHLEEVSHPEHLGENLRRYDLPEFVATQWFHNPVGVDLLFYPPQATSASASAIGRWTLYIHNSFVPWEIDSGVKTGQTLAEDEEGYAHGIVKLETRMVEYDLQADKRLIDSAKEIVMHAPIADVQLKTLVISHLNGVV